MKKVYDVIIIGAGIIGLSTAYYLTQKGKKVLILEKKEIGAGASSACDDMIFLQSKKPGILLQMALESLEMYKYLSKELETDLEFQTRGGMILIENQEQLRIMEDFVYKQRSYGLDVELIDKRDVKEKQPFISDRVIASTYSPIDSQVNPFRVMRGFYLKSLEKGMEIKKGAPVIALKKLSDGSWKVLTTENKYYHTRVVVNAAGAWAAEVGKMVGIKIPIKPKKGQIAVTEQIPCLGETNIWDADYIVTKLIPALAEKRGRILSQLGIGLSFTQTHDGNYFIGGTREFVGFDSKTTYQGISNIIPQALKFFPVLKNVHIIRAFAGLRPASLDGKPFLGEVKVKEGFFIAAGHEGDGIALAPITGKIMAQMICGETPSLPVGELSPDRLLDRQEVMNKIKLDRQEVMNKIKLVK
ncbi:MAG TPA: FAD-binding oxidoreductase [Candidatus Atribacteria bacterium]|nr:FAD-binding oxidoreductase [Candidatus Atribacteria bacterium]